MSREDDYEIFSGQNKYSNKSKLDTYSSKYDRYNKYDKNKRYEEEYEEDAEDYDLDKELERKESEKQEKEKEKEKGKQKSSKNKKELNLNEDPDEVVFHIKEFDINSIPPHKPSDHSGVKIVVIGKAGMGKSTIIKSILASKAHMTPVIQVYNGTEDANGAYGNICPPVCIHDRLDLNAMIQFINRQKIAARNIDNPWAIQVIDDCTDDPSQLRSPVFQEYYKNGRHWHMIHILSLQYALDILPSIRGNIDYVFLTRESGKKTRKKLYDNYCPDCVETEEQFNALMDACTENYGSLVICNRTVSNKIEDCIFWYKADPQALPDNWRLCHPTSWKFHNERYDPNYEPPLLEEKKDRKRK